MIRINGEQRAQLSQYLFRIPENSLLNSKFWTKNGLPRSQQSFLTRTKNCPSPLSTLVFDSCSQGVKSINIDFVYLQHNDRFWYFHRRFFHRFCIEIPWDKLDHNLYYLGLRPVLLSLNGKFLTLNKKH